MDGLRALVAGGGLGGVSWNYSVGSEGWFTGIVGCCTAREWGCTIRSCAAYGRVGEGGFGALSSAVTPVGGSGCGHHRVLTLSASSGPGGRGVLGVTLPAAVGCVGCAIQGLQGWQQRAG